MSNDEFSEPEANTLESSRRPEGQVNDAQSISTRVDVTRIQDLERAIARLDAQLRGVQERVAEFEGQQRAGRQRALYFRLALLFLLLAGYMYMRSRVSG